MAALRDSISPFARELTALFVDDDAVSRRLMAEQLKGVFRELTLAADGREGLAAFQARRPQIVFTDNRMPFMSGIEMTAAIRRIDLRVPVVFITSSMDTALLVQALNLGIAAFVPKPAGPDTLRQAVATVVAMLENEHLQHQNRDQELALLQFRDKYHEHQQDLAFRKELSLLEDDYRHRSFQGAAGQGEWIAQVQYSPHDIMCGDSYSLRRFSNGMLVLIADAMGKGLAASITSSICAHAFNATADRTAAAGPLQFRNFVQRYTAQMRKRLVEDEVLPLALLWLPAGSATLETAAFGLPPILVAETGAVRKLRCENPPLSPYFDTFRTTVHDMGEARSVLLYTDGLNEAVADDGSLFRDNLEHELLGCAGLDQLWRTFQARVGKPDDDVTLLLLSRVDGAPIWQDALVLESRLEAVEQACQELEERLETRTALEPGPLGEFVMAIREAMLNAYEHGSLEIDFSAKRRLLEDGHYYQHLLAREAGLDRSIRVELAVLAHGGQRLVKVTIRDEGPGFTPPPYLFQEEDSMLLSGRGLKMVRKYTDAFYLSEKGNVITLIRFYPGGNDAGGPHKLH